MSKCGSASATKTWSRYRRWVTIVVIESDVRLHVMSFEQLLIERTDGEFLVVTLVMIGFSNIRRSELARWWSQFLITSTISTTETSPGRLLHGLGSMSFEATGNNETWAKCYRSIFHNTNDGMWCLFMTRHVRFQQVWDMVTFSWVMKFQHLSYCNFNILCTTTCYCILDFKTFLIEFPLKKHWKNNASEKVN